MGNSIRITRRRMLQGVGVSLALPWLESLQSAAAWGAVSDANPASRPVRMAFLTVPNGIHMQDWTPTTDGFGFKLPYTLEPLSNVQDDLLVLTGLTHDKGRANGDGPGDHARSAASFLTGCQARKTAGADIKLGVSVDQVAAQKIGKATRFPSLELGIEPGPSSGGCDSGYSCAYSNNISWRSETTPVPKEVDPRLVFERLFGNSKSNEVGTSQSKRDEQKKSILDFVQEDARDLRNRLGIRDQQKLDEYLH